MLTTKFSLLLLLFTLTFTSGNECQFSNDTYIIILGDYTSTNHAELNPYQPPANPRVRFLNLTSWSWQNSNQTLPSLEGNEASPWFYFGNQLASLIPSGNIYISVLAFDSASIYDFAYVNNTNTKWVLLNNTISLIPRNISVDVLWMMGENDATISDYISCYYSDGKCYNRQLSKLINWTPECYSWGISLTSYSPYHLLSDQNYIRQQQAYVIKSFNNSRRVWSGPDTDQLCNTYRHNNLYFNINGTMSLVNQWIYSRNNKTNTVNPNEIYCNYYIITINKIIWGVIGFVCFTATVIGIFFVSNFIYRQCIVRQRSQYEPLKTYYYINDDKV
jgi:hypothetical protein